MSENATPTNKPTGPFTYEGKPVHPDSKVMLNEPDKARYGNVRFIDAESFHRDYPDVRLVQSFIIGSFNY